VPDPNTRVCGTPKSAGEVRRQVRHDVDRVGDDEQHGLWRHAEHRRDDLPEHVGVALQQLESRFVGLLRHAAGDDDDTCAFEIAVFPRADAQRVRERNRVVDVIGFGLGACPIHVNQNDFPPHTTHDECVRRGRADHSASDDADFHDGPGLSISVLTPDWCCVMFAWNSPASLFAVASQEAPGHARRG
jgi:hypothetical protein